MSNEITNILLIEDEKDIARFIELELTCEGYKVHVAYDGMQGLMSARQINPDLIVLAGFLWKFPEHIIDVYTNKIINIHPALLPKYGGKGMYGINVHKAVLENKETETGITIHYINKNYDEGEFIFQKSVSIIECKSAEEIATKIHYLEMDNFPKVIEQLISK